MKHPKRTIGILLAVVLLLALAAVLWVRGFPSKPAEVPAVDANMTEIAIEYAQAYMDSPDGQGFCPDELTSRAVLLQALYRISGSPEPYDRDAQFDDVAPDAEYAAAAKYFKSQFQSFPLWNDTPLRPEEPVTVQEAAALLYGNAAVFLTTGDYERRAENTLQKDFQENKPEVWAKSGLSWAVAMGLLPQSAASTPTQPLIREQTALLLYGYKDILEWPGEGNADGSEKNVLTVYGQRSNASYVLSRADARKLKKLFQDDRWIGLGEERPSVELIPCYAIQLGDTHYSLFSEYGQPVLYYNYALDTATDTEGYGGHPTKDPALVAEIFNICRSYAPPVKGEP